MNGEIVDGSLKVLAVPFGNPDIGRVDMTVPEGLSLAEIVRVVYPGATEADHAAMRVAITSGKDVMVVERQHWHRVRPRQNVQIVIRVIPGKSAMRAILSIVVAVAALALGQIWAASLSLGATATSIAQGVIGAGVSSVGAIQLDALMPARTSTVDGPPHE